jgi:hypothetical protein
MGGELHLLWASPPLRATVEAAVSRHAGWPWTIRQATDLTAFACHPAGVLTPTPIGVVPVPGGSILILQTYT